MYIYLSLVFYDYHKEEANSEAGMFIIIVQQFNIKTCSGGQRKKYSIDDYLYQMFV